MTIAEFRCTNVSESPNIEVNTTATTMSTYAHFSCVNGTRFDLGQTETDALCTEQGVWETIPGKCKGNGT